MGLMQELLATRGYDVVAVPDAIHAEAEILRHPPDLILSDVVMPGKSGYELCRELKENPATRLIPFVLITGLTDRQDRCWELNRERTIFCTSRSFPRNCLPGSSLCSSSRSLPTNWRRQNRCCARWA